MRLFDTIPTDRIEDLRTRALLETLFASGMRIGEALSLRIKNIDWEKQEAIIRGKGGDERVVGFTERALYWLRKYLKRREDNCEWLFANRSGTGGLKQAAAKYYLRTHQKEWNLDKHITFHTFRRSLATYLMNKKMELKQVQNAIGWKSERTLLRYYACVNKEKARENLKRIANLKGK